MSEMARAENCDENMKMDAKHTGLSKILNVHRLLGHTYLGNSFVPEKQFSSCKRMCLLVYEICVNFGLLLSGLVIVLIPFQEDKAISLMEEIIPSRILLHVMVACRTVSYIFAYIS